MAAPLPLDVEEPITLESSDGVQVVIASNCLDGSQFLAALVRDGEEVVEVPNIPGIYLRFAAQFLVADCQGDAEALDALVTTRNVLFFPELNRYVFGYLAIDAFQPFYQRMLVAALRDGVDDPVVSTNLLPSSLLLLNDAQLYVVARHNTRLVQPLAPTVPNIARFYLLRSQRYTLALYRAAVLEVKQGQLYVNQRAVPYLHHVVSVELDGVSGGVFVLADGEVWSYRLDGTELRRGSRYQLPFRVRALSLAGGMLSGVSEDGDAFVSGRLTDIRNVREAVNTRVIQNDGVASVSGEPVSHHDLEVAPDLSQVLRTDLTTQPATVTRVYGVETEEVVFTERLEAVRLGQVLERDVIAFGYDPATQRAVFRASNGFLRYWRAPREGDWSREYQVRR